ncbi:uncharacterized protein LOC119405069 isoform X2 [Rhipicephalus sanguineus]|uniref:Ubiquitin thioesterase otulin n=1 Tax=Rhipicephalus sanguineus TaxID=34632 RepID=A0A9D4SNE2_RHISA|nr:uncharacterized protein LOC119405069 isoform X2 [Rhipicephalus sanguineus]KAH7935702.1 hypothetical protein HPB52_012610 [Rhipicephalus sanguineus]
MPLWFEFLSFAAHNFWFESLDFAHHVWFESRDLTHRLWFDLLNLAQRLWFESASRAHSLWFEFLRFAQHLWIEAPRFARRLWFLSLDIARRLWLESQDCSRRLWLEFLNLARHLRLELLRLARLIDVRTTSVILLLGVGSFVCYKLYCQLRQRFRRRKKRETAALRKAHVRSWISGVEHGRVQECYLESDNESEISEASLPATSQASFGDIDASSSCGGGFLSDDDIWDMGVTSSNPYEPVRFDSQSGDVRFQGCAQPKASTPLNIARNNQKGGSVRHRNKKAKSAGSPVTRQTDHSPRANPSVKADSGSGDVPASVKNNNNNVDDRAPLSDDSISQEPEGLLDSLSYEGGGEAATPWANDTVSLLANFSIGSLSERNRRTEELISSRANSQGEETDDFSMGGMVSDSALLRLRNSHSHQLSVDSEASDLSIFERAQAPLEVPCEAFETIDKIETILHDTKQELLDLDADLVSLRVFQKLPANYDVVLGDAGKKSGDESSNRRASIRNAEIHTDSGSDFGNSLESDSERLVRESSGPSLEWDSLPLSKQPAELQHESDSTDFGTFSEWSESEDGGAPRPSVLGVVRRHSSGNIHSKGTLREEIQRILYAESESWKRNLVRSHTLPVDQSLPESERNCDAPSSETRESLSLHKITTVPEESTLSPSSVSDFASLAASSDRDASMDTNGNDLMDVERDDEGSNFESAESPVCVEDKVTLADYIFGLRRKRKHQPGDGMEKTLAAVLSGLEVRSLRRIKNDGYAAIRAAGFQVLASGGSILSGHRGANGVYQRFHDASVGTKTWLEGWTFHRSLQYTQALQGFWECLSALQDLEDQLRLTASPAALLASKLNEDSTLDAKLVEAVKIVMLKSALELFAAQKDSDAPCPLFATVLFAQVTSTSPEEHLVSHVSRLGKSRAVPEADLYLLGYALGTTLTVVRPSQGGNEDYVSRYPEWQVGSWPEAVLVEHEGRYWACAT